LFKQKRIMKWESIIRKHSKLQLEEKRACLKKKKLALFFFKQKLKTQQNTWTYSKIDLKLKINYWKLREKLNKNWRKWIDIEEILNRKFRIKKWIFLKTNFFFFFFSENFCFSVFFPLFSFLSVFCPLNELFSSFVFLFERRILEKGASCNPIVFDFPYSIYQRRKRTLQTKMKNQKEKKKEILEMKMKRKKDEKGELLYTFFVVFFWV